MPTYHLAFSDRGEVETFQTTEKTAAYNWIFDRATEYAHSSGLWPEWYSQVGPAVLPELLPALHDRAVYLGLHVGPAEWPAESEFADLGVYTEPPVCDALRGLNMQPCDWRML